VSKQYSHKDKEELVAENLQLRASLSKKEAELAELKRLIFGRKTERFVAEQEAAEQLNLFSNIL
jgi:hypothetical protein